ncbi:MAG: AraC family transcriptional regulator [Chitinophagaceae bacterium]|nr:MAG: AraC family transcriptional regulator [Chitinophagaceae bacterium]
MYTTVQVLRNIIYAAAARGGNLKQLTLAAGLRLNQLHDSEYKVEGVAPVIGLWEEVLSSTGDPSFGLHFGKQYNPSMLGLLGFLIQSCRNLGDAYQHLEKYQELVSGWITYKLVQHKNQCEIHYTVNPVWQHASPHTAKQALENAMSASLTSHGLLTQSKDYPLYAELSYPQSVPVVIHEKVFGCPIAFGKAHNKLVFAADFAQRPLVNYDQSLYMSFSSMLKEKLVSFAVNESFAKELQNIIIRDFLGHAPKLAIISAHLNMSERSFQRKLQIEDKTYRSIITDLKKELAFTLLKNDAHNRSTVSALLGYAEPTAFYRAFKKWKKPVYG